MDNWLMFLIGTLVFLMGNLFFFLGMRERKKKK